ncbi:MAG: hypothetical protein V4480_00550 [Patescibacteria group bacterium]
MSFLTMYIAYLRDNPQGYWFKAKLYGWGWIPVKWQGWCVLLAYVALIMTSVISREKDIPGNPDSGGNFLTFALPIIALTALLVFICYKRGEKPRWQWGQSKK